MTHHGGSIGPRLAEPVGTMNRMGPGREAEVLERDLSGAHFGETQVVNVRVTRAQEESGEWAIYLDVILSDPPGDRGTWPVEDVLSLRRYAVELAAAQEDDVMVYVRVAPTTDTTQEGEEEEGGKGFPQTLF